MIAKSHRVAKSYRISGQQRVFRPILQAVIDTKWRSATFMINKAAPLVFSMDHKKSISANRTSFRKPPQAS